MQGTPWPDITPYNVTKSGIKMLMRGMARELAAKGIRVNSIAPGIVAVGMAKRQGDTEPDYRRRAEKAIPLGFMQPPGIGRRRVHFSLLPCLRLHDGRDADGGWRLQPLPYGLVSKAVGRREQGSLHLLRKRPKPVHSHGSESMRFGCIRA